MLDKMNWQGFKQNCQCIAADESNPSVLCTRALTHWVRGVGVLPVPAFRSLLRQFIGVSDMGYKDRFPEDGQPWNS